MIENKRKKQQLQERLTCVQVQHFVLPEAGAFVWTLAQLSPEIEPEFSEISRAIGDRPNLLKTQIFFLSY